MWALLEDEACQHEATEHDFKTFDAQHFKLTWPRQRIASAPHQQQQEAQVALQKPDQCEMSNIAQCKNKPNSLLLSQALELQRRERGKVWPQQQSRENIHIMSLLWDQN